MKKGPGLFCGKQAGCFFLFLVFIGSYAGSYAQESSPFTARKKVFSAADTLREVQIRGLMNPATASSSTPAQILKGEQLNRLNSLSVADALRYFSGIQLKDYGGIGGLKTVDVRSLGSHHTTVFYDGVAVSNVQNGQVDLGRFSLDNIEEVALYNAQKGGIFQSAKAFSSSATIFLKSRTPSFISSRTDHLGLAFNAGSFGLLNPSLLWQHKINRKISTSLSTEWLQSNGRYKFRYTNSVYDTTARRQNSDITGFRTEGGLYGTEADSSTWALKLYHYQSERGLPRAIVSNNFESANRQWDRNTFIQGNWQSAPRKRYQVMLNSKYAFDYLRYLDPQYDNIEGKLDHRYRQHEWYLSGTGLYHISDLFDASLSSDVTITRLDANLDHFSYPTRYAKLLVLATEFHRKSFLLQGNILGSFISETVKYYTAAPRRSRISPTLIVSLKASDALSFRAFYKDIFRMPTFNDLYYTGIGNTGLQPEKTQQYNFGTTFSKTINDSFFQHWSLQADAYYNKVTDKIVAIPKENIGQWMMMNLGKVDIKGAELTMKATAKTGEQLILGTTLCYTYQEALDVTNASDFNYRQQIPYIPKNSGSATLSATWPGLWLSYSYIYTGERYSQKANIPENYLEPWYTHDLSITARMSNRPPQYTLTAEMNNIFNQYRDVVRNFPMPGRSYRFTFRLHY